MKKQILTVVLSSTLLLSGCANWCDECADGSCEVTSQVVLPSSSALFAFDSATLTPAADQALAPIVDRLHAEPTERVQISGYTDSTGPEAYNLKLSQRRADAVAAYLAANGVSYDRISTRGFGEADPVDTNATAEGRQQNRRAVVTTYK